MFLTVVTSGFVPYWSEGVLVVPRDSAPYLVVALSFRVKSWIERVSRVGDVLHTPRIGLKAGQEIAKAGSTGTVDTPQVHFEIRQGSRAIDPVNLLPSVQASAR